MYDLDVPSASRFVYMSVITDPTKAYVYLILFGLLLLSAFFAGTETAYSYCNRHRLKVYADDGKKSAKLALFIFERFEATLITTLIGTNIAHIAISVLATLLCISIFASMGSLIATIISTILVFFFGDMIPKNIAQVNADRWCMHSSYIVIILFYLLWPISIIFRGLIALIKLIIHKKDEDTFTEDDFQDVVEKIEEDYRYTRYTIGTSYMDNYDSSVEEIIATLYKDEYIFHEDGSMECIAEAWRGAGRSEGEMIIREVRSSF